MSASDNWLDEQNKQRPDYQKINEVTKEPKFCEIIRSQNVTSWALILLFSLFIPCLVYFFIIDEGTFPPFPRSTCMIEDDFRIPCGRPNLTHEECWSLSCCFDPRDKYCYHSLPSQYLYTKTNDLNIYSTSVEQSPVGTQMIPKVIFTVSEQSENVVKVKLEVYKGNKSFYNENETIDIKKNYYIALDENALTLEVFRKDTKELLLTTAGGPLIFSENYFEWSLYLTNGSLFGPYKNLLNSNNGRLGKEYRKTLYNNKLDHYNIPIFWAYTGGKFHRVSIAHEGPLEIIIKPSNLIILRSLTSDPIEIELDTGYTPKMLHDAVMKNSQIPPYWAMETHVCRIGNTLDLQEIIADFKFDDISSTYCIDGNLFMALMKDNGRNINALKDIFNDGVKREKKFVMSLPPHILFDSNLHKKAEELGILYQYNGSTYAGSYLNENVVYPDYNSPCISTFINELYTFITQYVTIPIDGLVLKDNWPADDSYSMNGSDFKYFTKELEEAMSYTLPWNSISSYTGLQIESHNSYSTGHLNAIRNFLTSKKSDIFIVSSSNSLGQEEPILVEGVDASWDELKSKLENILFDSIAVDHLVSLPVCGDTMNFDPRNEILCLRWYLISVTMPMLRISSVKPWRDPQFLNTTHATRVASKALNLRNQLLMHYSTLLYFREPVIRPMFYDFHDDEATFKLETQYMVGGNILVAQPFTSGRKMLHVYLPSTIGIWYEMWGGGKYNSTVNPWINVTVLENDFVAFLAHGTILPLKDNNTINLIIAENCTESCRAEGFLLMGNIVNFSVEDKNLVISNLPSKCDYTLGSIKTYGYGTERSLTNQFDIPICDGKDTISINYIDKKKTGFSINV